MKANRLLSEEIAGSERLFPCWTLLPDHAGDVPGAGELAAELRRHGVRAVRLVPGPYNLVFRERLLRDLLRMLERERVLTIVQLPTLGVPVPEKEDVFLRALEEVCDRHPRLALLTCGRLRNFYPLLERFPRLLTSLAWDPHPDFVEDFCRRFGSRRLLFATPYSENAREISGMPMLQVTHAAVNDEEKARIAGLNLAELLGVELRPLRADRALRSGSCWPAAPRRFRSSTFTPTSGPGTGNTNRPAGWPSWSRSWTAWACRPSASTPRRRCWAATTCGATRSWPSRCAGGRIGSPASP